MPDNFPRFQQIVLPILRAGLPGVEVTSWGADIDHRTFPTVNVRRIGGTRHRTHHNLLDKPVIELAVYSTEGLIECEELYIKALELLYEAQSRQTIAKDMDGNPTGYIHSIFETMGMSQFSSLYMDSWRVQGLIQLGIRPPN